MEPNRVFTSICLASFCMTVPTDCPPPRCYMLLFGGLGQRGRPNTAHTWATFARATPSPHAIELETFTISWLPCELPVQPFRTARPGRNYDLHETIAIMRTGREQINLWGPLEILPCFFNQAQAQKEFLDRGGCAYRVFDGGSFKPLGLLNRTPVCHCVHAITRANDQLYRESEPVLWYGGLITRRVAAALRDSELVIHPELTHDWLLDALELRGDEFVRRALR